MTTLQDRYKDLSRKIANARQALLSLTSQRDQAEAQDDNRGRPDYWRLKNQVEHEESLIVADERELQHLERDLAWERQASSCEATIKGSRKALTTLAKDLGNLETNRAKLAGKLAKVQGDIEQTLSGYEQAERQAAEAYAAAMASSDAQAEQSAQAALERAGEDLDSAQRKAKRQQPIVDALTKEMALIDGKVTVAMQEQQEQREVLLSALRFKHGQAWDKAARDLVAAGAQLAALERVTGGRTFEDLNVPLFDRLGSRQLTQRDIEEAAQGLDVDGLAA